jgi:hypothetical protein
MKILLLSELDAFSNKGKEGDTIQWAHLALMECL